jgi:hypothetical protein
MLKFATGIVSMRGFIDSLIDSHALCADQRPCLFAIEGTQERLGVP